MECRSARLIAGSFAAISVQPATRSRNWVKKPALAGVREWTLAAARVRCVHLESELVTTHGRAPVAVSRRLGAGTLWGGITFKRRK